MLLRVSLYLPFTPESNWVAEDPDNADGDEEEEHIYPLVDELFSRIEELEMKVWLSNIEIHRILPGSAAI